MATDYLDTVEFIHDFINKEKKAHNAFFGAHFSKIYSYATRLVDYDEAKAEDIVMIAFSIVFGSHKQYASSNNIIASLYLIVRNDCLDYLRSPEYRRSKHRISDDHQAFINLAENDSGLENAQIEGEVMEALYQAMNQLPDECGKVIKLIFFDRLKYQEVADRLGISINSVKTQRRIGLLKLRESLSDKQLLTLVTLHLTTIMYCHS